MNNQRGLTLIELLASVMIIAFVTITVVFVLQQSSVFSQSNSEKESNVLVARTVMENIKSGLKAGETITLYGSDVSLSGLKANSNAALATLLIPNSTNPKKRIDVRTLPIPNDTVSIRTNAYHIGNYFRRVQVTVTEVATNRSYSLQAYVEFN